MHSAGIDALCHEIAGRLVPHPPPPGAAVPFEPEQIEQIRGYLARCRVVSTSRPTTEPELVGFAATPSYRRRIFPQLPHTSRFTVRYPQPLPGGDFLGNLQKSPKSPLDSA